MLRPLIAYHTLTPPLPHCWTVQLDNLSSGDNIIDIQDALYEITGARSVPRVFVGGKFIGGGDDTAAKASSGELKQLLVAAGAVKE
jgi:glutaredoxin 3